MPAAFQLDAFLYPFSKYSFIFFPWILVTIKYMIPVYIAGNKVFGIEFIIFSGIKNKISKKAIVLINPKIIEFLFLSSSPNIL